MKVEDKQANNFRNPPEDTSVNYVKQPHLQKATIVVVVAETTSSKNVDSNMKIVGTATQKGTSPKFAPWNWTLVHRSRSCLRRLGEKDSRQLHSKSHKLNFPLILEKPSTSSGKLMCKSHIKIRSPIYRFRSSKEKVQAYLEETGLGTLSWTGGQLRR